MSPDFAPVSGLIGGALIGLAAVLLLIANGRIAGVSGIVGGLLARVAGDIAWRAAFMLGLWLGALLYWGVRSELFEMKIESSLPLTIAAGLLVGFGAPRQRLHERSRRLRNRALFGAFDDGDGRVHGCGHRYCIRDAPRLMKTAPLARAQPLFALLSGMLFGLGLAISGMANPAKVLAFLDIAGEWDPTLALVMLGALAVTSPAFRYVLKLRQPWFAPGFALPTKTELEPRLITGAALFGIGWGLAGFCPGPAITALVTGNSTVFAFVAAMFVGFAVHDWLDEWLRLRGAVNARLRQGSTR